MAEIGNKQFLDEEGVRLLWENIKTKFVTLSTGQTIIGNKSFNGTIKIIGTAADHKLWTRGIVGSDVDGTTLDTLHLQFGNTVNDTVAFGSTAGGTISNNGTQYSGNAATATTANKTKSSLTIQKNGTQVGNSFNGETATTINITVPTKLSELNNDNNYVVDANYVHTDNNYNIIIIII